MTGEQTLLARAVMGFAGGASGVALVRWRRPQEMSAAAFDRSLLAAQVLSRLGLWLLIFVLLHVPVRGDVVGYYVPEGLAALAGKLPYRDFDSSYAPLHAYLDAAALRLWSSPRMLILLAIAAEAVALPMWVRLARRARPEPTVRRAALLYVASAISLVFCAIDGQDNVVIALLVAASLLLVLARREVLAGALLGLSAVVVKVIPLGYVPVLFLATARRGRWLAGVLAVLVAGYGVFFRVVGRALLMPLLVEGKLKSAGDLPYVLEAVAGVALPRWLPVLLLATAVAAILLRLVWLLRRDDSDTMRLDTMLFGVAAVTLALELLSNKSWPPYLMLVLFPLLLAVAESGRAQTLMLLGGFGVVALVEHSYWATMLGQFQAPAFHAGLRAGDGRCFVFLALELLLLAGYGWLLRLCWRAMGGVRAVADGDVQSAHAGVPVQV